MKKSFKNILSAAALLMLTATSAFADGEDKGVKTNKSVKDNGDGTYTLTLETWADGEITIETSTVRQPMDAVLVLDISGSMNETYSGSGNNKVTRLQAMKTASKKFIDLVAADAVKDNDNIVDHKISIVVYSSGDHNKIERALTDVSLSGNAAALKSVIDGLSYGGGTEHDEGLKLAQSALGTKDPKRSRVIVFLTDGQPTGSNTSFFGYTRWDEDVVKNAISTSNDLKKDGVTIFAIDMASASEGGDDASTSSVYLEHLSSNYSTSSYRRNWGRYEFSGTSAGASADYYKYASSDLDNVFSNIAKDITSNLAKTELTKENSSVRDYITPQFKINGSASDIRTKLVAATTLSDKSLGWGSVINSSEDNIKVEAPDNSVIITGFDFQKYAVAQNPTTKQWTGAKLVIEIDIVQNGDNAGGVITTNKPESGIYHGEGQEADFESTGIEFPVPQAINKAKAYLHIVKNDLAVGESAIFEVMVSGEVINTVMVQKTSDDAVADAYVLVDWLTSAGKAKEYTSANPLTLDDMVKFVVVEKADWAWNSPDPASITSELYEVNSDTDLWEEYTFTFEAGNPKYEGAHKEISTVIE
ncbi:MAG: VWA domain-containing protein [Bacteroidales bacterium]|nr:VWA domain-containing protein [Bacteroidales bacterium]